MKRLSIILCLVLVLPSCKKHPPSYAYPNPVDEILSVELIHNQNNEGYGIDEEGFVHIRYLEEQEVEAFISEIRSLETRWWKSRPIWGYGPYFARVVYLNGDVEILGVINIEFISAGEDPSGYGRYYYNWDSFMEVFLEYAQTPFSS